MSNKLNMSFEFFLYKGLQSITILHCYSLVYKNFIETVMFMYMKDLPPN